ncbi:MAG: hypothetical protein QOD07_3011, partial [Frankiaceae bacterium]|nr:hypothetical protein [Frankiaceae bacterium]
MRKRQRAAPRHAAAPDSAPALEHAAATLEGAATLDSAAALENATASDGAAALENAGAADDNATSMRCDGDPGTSRRRSEVRPVAVAVGMYVAVRLLMLAAIVLTAHARGQHAAGRLTKADGYWYLRIATHGYGHPPPIGADGAYTHTTPLAFFPLYPWLVRAVSFVGIPKLYAALLITGVAGTVAAAFITLWARSHVGDRGAIVLTAVWSVLPTSAVLDMAYSEALFVAAAAATLLALQRRRLVVAALACSVAGLTRPTAAGLVVGVLIAVALDVRRTALTARHVAAALLAPAGLALSLGHV